MSPAFGFIRGAFAKNVSRSTFLSITFFRPAFV